MSYDIWVPNYGSNNVTRISPTGEYKGWIPVGSRPWGVAVDPSGTGIGNKGNGQVWISNAGSNSVHLIPMDNVELAVEITGVGFEPHGIALDPSGYAWVAAYNSNFITKIDPSGNIDLTGEIGQNAEGVAIDSNGNIYVACAKDDKVWKLFPDGTKQWEASIKKESFFSGTRNPIGIAIDSVGNVWTANYNSNSVTKLNSQGELQDEISVGKGPMGIIAVTPGQDMIIVSNSVSNTISILNNDCTVLAVLPMEPNGFKTRTPIGLSISYLPDYIGYFVVTFFDSDSIALIYGITQLVTASIGCGHRPLSIGDMTGWTWDQFTK